MANDKSPHCVQLSVQIAIYPRLKDGSLDSMPLTYEQMQEYGLKERVLFEIEGFDKFEAIRKTHEVLNGIKR